MDNRALTKIWKLFLGTGAWKTCSLAWSWVTNQNLPLNLRKPQEIFIGFAGRRGIRMYTDFQPAVRRQNARNIKTAPPLFFCSCFNFKNKNIWLDRFSLFLWVSNHHFNHLVYIHILKRLFLMQKNTGNLSNTSVCFFFKWSKYASRHCLYDSCTSIRIHLWPKETS